MVSFTAPIVSTPHVDSGKLRALVEFAAFVRRDWEMWDKLIKQQGIKLD